jgi:hypothetical protein
MTGNWLIFVNLPSDVLEPKFETKTFLLSVRVDSRIQQPEISGKNSPNVNLLLREGYFLLSLRGVREFQISEPNCKPTSYAADV